MFLNIIVWTGMDSGDSRKPEELGQPLCRRAELGYMWLTKQVLYDV